MQNKYKIISILLILILGSGHANAKDHIAQELPKLPEAAYSLEGVVDVKKSPLFACHFGRFTVEMVPSQYKDNKYFKVSGTGVLVNSVNLVTKIGSSPQIIYAVPKDAPISNGSVLSAYCISQQGLSHVPYEGPERKDIDQSAAVIQFYLLEE